MSPRQATTPSIMLRDVAIIRGNRLVFDGLSFEAKAGDIIWIRGANGSGKSTLLRLIAGLLPRASGQMTIEGNIALADENLALDPNMTLETALGFWARMDGVDADWRENALAAMDLVPLADIPVHYLSTGQQKRASLSRLFASRAEMWLLDEPYNGLDSASSTRLDTALVKHASKGGIALVAAHQTPSINIAQSILLDRQAGSA